MEGSVPVRYQARPAGSLLRYFVRAVLWAGLVIGLPLLVIWQRQAINDWWRLRGYTPPTQVVALANDTTMTPEARHLFYLNHPQVARGSAFSSNCPVGGEKSIVLGCYKGGDNGIYIYNVTDSRLRGVVEVTAAHEMLHAAYERLSLAERRHINDLLTSYYAHDLTDQRIRRTIDSYKQTEPTELANEMHSIFGTEVRSLPAELEQYYTRYFTSRTTVVGYAEAYQSEFTGRQDKLSSYDSQLAQLKSVIETAESALTTKRSAIESKQAEMEQLKSGGDIGAYNALVNEYNDSIDSYNTGVGQLKSDIERYNTIVDARNAVAMEEQELTKQLSPQAVNTL